jgi:hypothetical protein|tara:strand:+ start:485 stop:796 length:312 start_codon:yes stop_codon:yes gene_type:complete
MNKITMNTIKITGKLWFGADSPELYMKDMLRYDNGTIFSLEHEDGNRDFEAIVVSKRYTPARWQSFGLQTELLEGTKEAKKEQALSLKNVQTWINNSKNVSVI